MGEAKRRAAARPYATTSPRQLARTINEAFANLPPSPINGANQIDMSPADFDRLCVVTEVSPFDGRTLSGVRVIRDERLIDGVFIGRRNGKAVWSNVPKMQEAINADFASWWSKPTP